MQQNDSARDWDASARPAPRAPIAVAPPADPEPPRVGVVVIGRNEGDRLMRCLRSLTGAARQVVYVDSGSTDDSVEAARSMGVATVELDMRIPFAPGRARNAGYQRLRELLPKLDYVQFVDGDCEVDATWLEQAAEFLRTHEDVAVLGGRRYERHPDRSVYNRICAMEWDAHPIGEATTCGGDALMRADAFEAASGYRTDLMAGEEPELCERLRAAGWRVWFLNAPLTTHDAAMLRFGQWWQRSARSGYGATQRACVCPAADRVKGLRDIMSCWAWVIALPGVAVTLSLAWGPWALTLLLLYPMQVIRVALRSGRGESWKYSLQYSLFLLIAKVPKLIGQLTFLRFHWGLRPARLIEYKS